MRSSSILLCSILLFGCKKDKDGDGFTEKDGDCDDNDDTIFPSADEICDGLDNNCDDEIDEGLSAVWYIDADADGYGDPDIEVEACEQPDGYVENSEDCDNSNELVYPGAEELDCTDPTDYNCDGSVGYEDADADGAAACEDCDDADADIQIPTWYIDYDGDGYGFFAEAYNTDACEAPTGYVENFDDCNDTSAAANPDGVEVCDELDNDCDGLVDANDDDVLDAGTYFPDNDGDGYGDEDSAELACEGISGFVDLGGDCDDTSDQVNPEQDEICNDGLDNNCSEFYTGIADDFCWQGLEAADAYWLAVDADDAVGIAYEAAGDINSDGYDDILIGGYRADGDGDGEDEGVAYIVYGSSSIGGTMDYVDAADQVIIGKTAGDQFGYRVTSLGDIDGDLVPDLGVTASLVSEHPTLTRSANGATYIFLGGNIGTGELTAEDADIWIYGDGNYDWLGAALEPLGDLDSDGYDDFVVGSTGWDGEDNATSQGGGFFLYYGSASVADVAEWDSAAADVMWTGDVSNDRIGSAIEGLGDTNGDGCGDLLIGAKFVTGLASNSGALYLGLGAVDGKGACQRFSSGNAGDLDAIFYGGATDDQAGGSLSSAGDVNSDGYDDFYVAATGDNTTGGSGSGSVFLISGSATLDEEVDGLDLDSVNTAQVYGNDSNDSIGTSIAGNGDFDGDGNNDLLIGSTGAEDQGVAYLIYGPVSGQLDVEDQASRAMFVGANTDDSAGSTVNFLGDLNGSGNDAIGISAVNDNTTGTDAGAVYLMLSVGL